MAENSTSNSTCSEMFNFDIPLWAEVINTLFLSIVTIFGGIGNGMIFVVQLCNTEKSSTDILVLTMAIFEFLCAGFNSLVAMIRNVYWLWKPIASVTICCIHVFTLYTTSIACTLLLAAVAIDRYIHTCRPFCRFYTKTKAMWTSIAIAVISIVTASPMLQFTTLNEHNLNCETKKEQETVEQVLQFASAGSFILMFIAVVFCYTKVSLLLRRRHRQKLKIACAVASTSIRTVYNLSNLSASYEDKGKLSNQTRSVVQPNGSVQQKESALNEANLDETQSNDGKSVMLHRAGYIPKSSTPTENVQKTYNLKPTVTGGGAATSSIFGKLDNETRDETPPENSNVPVQSNPDITDRSTSSRIKHKFEIIPKKRNTAYDNTPANRKLKQEEKLVNRTTVIMFLISLIYILTWVIFWLAAGLCSLSTPTVFIIFYLVRYVAAINCMTNPIFFMLLSSRFRQKAKELLRATLLKFSF